MGRGGSAALAALAMALAGCVTSSQVQPTSLPLLDRLSPPDFDGLVKEALEVLSPDGKRLDTFVYRPDAPDGTKVPAIVMFSPYFANGASTARADNIDEQTGGTSKQIVDHFVPRGYAVVASSVRGTGYSEGCFTIGGPAESKDHVAVVEEIIAQPWSNGAVAAYGVSYVGTTANDLLTEGHPAVKTIVPVSAISDFYKYNFVNGVPINPQGYAFNFYYEEGVAIVPPHGEPSEDTIHLAAEETRCDHTEVQKGGFQSAATGDKSSYWMVRDYNLEVEGVRAPVFLVHGLQDWNVKTHHLAPWLDLLQDRVPTKVWMGQWAHNRPNANSYHEEWTRGDWNVTLLRWFDHWLKGIDTGILDEPLVDVQDDQGRWRHEERWPPVRAQPRAFYLDLQGLRGDPGAGARAWQDTGAPLPSPPAAGGLHYTVYESEPLPAELHLVGEPLLRLQLTHSAPTGTVAATLWDLAPNGTARRINYGFYDLEHRDSLEQGSPVPMGQVFGLEIPFFPQDDVVPAGHQLVLTLAGNDSPLCLYSIVLFNCATDSPDPGPLMQPIPSFGTTTVLHGEGSVLLVPTIGPVASFEPPRENEESEG